MSKRIRTSTSAKEIGSGAFGRAYSSTSPKRINQIKKVGRAGDINKSTNVKSVEEDGYLSYISTVYKLAQSGDNNPFFPRIFNLKIFRNEDGFLSYNLDMEKLVSLDSEHVPDLLLSQYYEELTTGMAGARSASPAREIAMMLDNAIQYGDFSQIRDKSLKKALAVVGSVRARGSFMPDLHAGNIMLRITGNKPQLVILDPIA
jgi:hypothetical protein